MSDTIYLVGDVNVQLDATDPQVDANVDDVFVNYGNLPKGGNADDLLIKQSSENFDAEWVAPAVAGFRHIYYDTVENWDAKTTLVSEEGALYVYKDYHEESGENVPGFKVGDGSTLLSDLLFVNQDIDELAHLTGEIASALEYSITTAVTDSFVAPKNLYTGDLVIVNGELYQVSRNITSGSPLIPNDDVSHGIVKNIVKRDLETYIGSKLTEPYPWSPADLGNPYSGSSGLFARGDHVHRKPTASEIGAYQKPVGGIPASDMAEGVIPPIFVAEYGVTTFNEVWQALENGKFVIAFDPRFIESSGAYGKPLVAWPAAYEGYIYFSSPVTYILQHDNPDYDHPVIDIHRLSYEDNEWEPFITSSLAHSYEIPVPSDNNPQPLGAASAGSYEEYSRRDHIHPMPSAADVGALPSAGGTMSGAIAMGSNKITGLANGTSDGDAVNFGQMSSAISQSAAYFRGTFNTKAALLAVQWQTSDPNAANYVTNNDYAIVQADETHNNECWRYVYVSGSGWEAQYKINDTPLTQAQLDAINSGANTTNIGSIANKYEKPSGGIPKSDLASEVQTSLGKADTALQSFTETDPTVPSWAKGSTKPSYTASEVGAATPEDVIDAYVTDTASGVAASFPDGADSIPIKALTVSIQPAQSGSGDPAPDNVRPISGWTGVTISHSGEDTSDPEIITISWQSEAGTIYGGTLDVLTGVLTVTHRYFIADGTTIKVTGGYGAGGPKWLPAIVLPTGQNGYGYPGIVCDKLKHVTAGSAIQNTENTIAFGNSGNPLIVLHIGTMQGTDGTHGYNSAAEVQAAVNAWLSENPLQICYKLAAPAATVQLDPETLSTLLGANNIWADTGDVTVEYRADPTLNVARINNRIDNVESDITATVVDEFKAPKNLVSGNWIIVQGVLYRVTTSIANGEPLIVGTNITATTVEDRVSAVKVSPYTGNPAALGNVSPGTSASYARGDHVHAKPTYTKTEIGLGNVDNVKQYSATNPPPYPVTSVNGAAGAVTIAVPTKTSDLANDSGFIALGGSTIASDGQIPIYRASGNGWALSDLTSELGASNAAIYYIEHDDVSDLFKIDCNITLLLRETMSERNVLFVWYDSQSTYMFSVKEILFDGPTPTTINAVVLQGTRYSGLQEVTFYFQPASSNPVDGLISSGPALWHKDDILTRTDAKAMAAVVDSNGSFVITTEDGDFINFTDLIGEYISVKNLEIGYIDPNVGIYEAHIGRITYYNYSTMRIDILFHFLYSQQLITFTQTTIDGVDALVSTAVYTTANLPAVSTTDNGKFLRVVNGTWDAVTVPNANGVSF